MKPKYRIHIKGMKKTLITAISGISLAIPLANAEPIPLYGETIDLEINEKLPETTKTWSDVRQKTLTYLKNQDIKTSSLLESQKAIRKLQEEMVAEMDRQFESLAERDGVSVEEVASMFQLGEGGELSKDLQDKSEIVDGLYQIESALIEKIRQESIDKRGKIINRFVPATPPNSTLRSNPITPTTPTPTNIPQIPKEEKSQERIEPPRLPAQNSQSHSMEW